MKQLIADWLWRGAFLGILCWIAWELHGIHGEMMLPVDEQSAATAPDSDSRTASTISGTT